jgi:hypothetical protein
LIEEKYWILINNFKPFSENIVMEIKKKIMELK